MTYPSSGSHADLFIYLDRSEAAHKRRGYGRNVGRRTVVERSNCSRTAVESQSNRSCNYCFSIHYSTAVLLLVRARKPGNGLSDAAELVGPELSPTSLQAPKAGGTMHMRIKRNVSHIDTAGSSLGFTALWAGGGLNPVQSSWLIRQHATSVAGNVAVTAQLQRDCDWTATRLPCIKWELHKSCTVVAPESRSGRIAMALQSWSPVKSKKDTVFVPITSTDVDRFSIFFTIGLISDCEMNWPLKIPTHLKRVATLPCETSAFKNWSN